MLSRFTKLRLVDLLYSFADGEIKLEVVRQVLAENVSFEPYAAFKRIALAPSPYLSSADLEDFLNDNNVIITSKEAHQLLTLYDTDRDGRLSFSEFLNAVLPKDDPQLRKRVTMRPTYDVEEDERLPYDIEYGIARIFEEELKNHKRAENLKLELSYCYDFSIINAFKTLDYDSKNYLVPEDIADFMEDNGRAIDDKELKALFRKIDLDLDSRINYSEFLNALFSTQVDLSSSKAENATSSYNRTHTSPKRTRKSSGDFEVGRRPVTSPRPNRNPRDAEYTDYLLESKIRSQSPRRETAVADEVYRTPNKSAKKGLEIDELDGGDVEERVSPRKSPLKGAEEEELVRAFKGMITSNRLLESAKNDLALRSDFNLFDAFRFFDINGKGAYISAKQFQDGCADLNLFPTKDEISLFFRKADTDYDGLLRFTDFCKILTPKSAEFSILLNNRKPLFVEEGEPIFTRETERLLSKVLDLAIENEVQAESTRQRLSRRPLFNLFDAFKAIDRYDQNFIVIDDLKDLLNDYGIFASPKDLTNLAERFKGDNPSTKITYSDFIKELSPKSVRIY